MLKHKEHPEKLAGRTAEALRHHANRHGATGLRDELEDIEPFFESRRSILQFGWTSLFTDGGERLGRLHSGEIPALRSIAPLVRRFAGEKQTATSGRFANDCTPASRIRDFDIGHLTRCVQRATRASRQ